jgi:DedD protein
VERALKERLIGAAVLVAVAIILIPEMLSGPSTSSPVSLTAHPVDVSIAGNANKSNADLSGSKSIPTLAVPNTSSADAQTTAENQTSQAGSQVGSQGEIKSFTIDLRKNDPQLQETGGNQTSPVLEQTKRPDQFPAAVSQETTVDGPSAQRTPDTSAVRQEQSTKVKPAEPSGPASTIERAGIEQARSASTAAAGWAVQLGSFGTRTPADQMVTELKKSGYEAFVMPFESNGKPMFRVRVGPFRDRPSAEAMQEKVKHTHPSATIVPHP